MKLDSNWQFFSQERKITQFYWRSGVENINNEG
jgi:hypothetical protein